MPVAQALPANGNQVAFQAMPYAQEFISLRQGCKVAAMALNLQMQSIEVEGVARRKGGLIIIDIKRVYNSMPPTMGYIYPRPDRPQEVRQF
jgi:hypothetical protein